jgi:ArsR family transcriptional regulator, virulence genes transcriptional regulator
MVKRVPDARMDPRVFEMHAEFCKTLAHPLRVELMKVLSDGERRVSDLAQAVDTRQPLVSQHLAVLRHLGLVRTRRDGNEVYYRVAYPKMVQACDLLREVLFEQLRTGDGLAAKWVQEDKGASMAEIQGFLGRDFEIPGDRLYDSNRHYWLKTETDDAGDLAWVGVSEPGVALLGAVIDLDLFPEAGEVLVVDQEIAFATTKKNMKYFLSPLSGTAVEANPEATPDAVNGRPYDTWLVKIRPEPGWEQCLRDAEAYAAALEGTEHATPEAARAAAAGKSSPTCKSVYGGIKEG